MSELIIKEITKTEYNVLENHNLLATFYNECEAKKFIDMKTLSETKKTLNHTHFICKVLDNSTMQMVEEPTKEPKPKTMTLSICDAMYNYCKFSFDGEIYDFREETHYHSVGSILELLNNMEVEVEIIEEAKKENDLHKPNHYEAKVQTDNKYAEIKGEE